MKRKRVDFASPSMVVKSSKRRRTDKEWVEWSVEGQVEQGIYLRQAIYLNRHFDERRRERERGLRSNNETRRRKAERDYYKYRDIAEMLSAGNPELQRATPHRLAKEVQAELIKQGRKVTARTIVKAFRLKNKV